PNRGVTFVVNVAWGSQLNICTDVALFANAPQQVLWIGPRTVSGTGTPGASDSSSSSVSSSASRSYAVPTTYHSATITAEGVEVDGSSEVATVSTTIDPA